MRRRWIINAALLVSAVAFIAATMNGVFSGEPTYKGRTLSGWMKMQERPPINDSGMVDGGLTLANEAIRHIGTNAIPFLLRMLTAQDSPRSSKINEWLQNHDHWERLSWRSADDWRGKF